MKLFRIATLAFAGVIAISAYILPTQSAYAQVKKAQELLAKLGYEVGEPDGAWGSKTRAALNAFQKEQGFQATRRLNKGAVSALELVAAGTKKLDEFPWPMEERIGNTLVLSNGARVHYTKKGKKIVRIKTGKRFTKTWKKKPDGTYCEYTFGTKRMECGNHIPKSYVIYPDPKEDGSYLTFNTKSGALMFSARLVEGNKLKP